MNRACGICTRLRFAKQDRIGMHRSRPRVDCDRFGVCNKCRQPIHFRGQDLNSSHKSAGWRMAKSAMVHALNITPTPGLVFMRDLREPFSKLLVKSHFPVLAPRRSQNINKAVQVIFRHCIKCDTFVTSIPGILEPIRAQPRALSHPSSQPVHQAVRSVPVLYGLAPRRTLFSKAFCPSAKAG